MQTVCVDFDGCINEYHGWKGPDVFGGLIPGAKEFLIDLSRKYEVVVLTTRAPDLVQEWLCDNELQYYVKKVTSVKPPAIAYIDDRAVRFEGDFSKVMELVEKRPWWQVKSSNEANMGGAK